MTTSDDLIQLLSADVVALGARAEAGCSTAEVAGITGQSLQVVEHYAKGRDEKALARSAMKKWEAK